MNIACSLTGSYNPIVCGPSRTTRFLSKPLQRLKSFLYYLKRRKKWVQTVFFASVVAHTSTLHGVVQWGKAFRALIKATPFV